MSIKRQRGLTMIELVIFMVITGVAAAGIIGALNIGARSSADPVRRKQALMIAEALMEEVLMARFTYCDPSDPNATIIMPPDPCSVALVIGTPSAGGRPYGNVANYANAAGTATRSFMVNGVDADINGRPLGQNAGLVTIGNVSLAGMTTTVTLNYLAGAGALGPVGSVRAISSAQGNLTALRITLRTTYGTGANDFVELDAYRTRYAPILVP